VVAVAVHRIHTDVQGTAAVEAEAAAVLQLQALVHRLLDQALQAIIQAQTAQHPEVL